MSQKTQSLKLNEKLKKAYRKNKIKSESSQKKNKKCTKQEWGKLLEFMKQKEKIQC